MYFEIVGYESSSVNPENHGLQAKHILFDGLHFLCYDRNGTNTAEME